MDAADCCLLRRLGVGFVADRTGTVMLAVLWERLRILLESCRGVDNEGMPRGERTAGTAPGVVGGGLSRLDFVSWVLVTDTWDERRLYGAIVLW